MDEPLSSLPPDLRLRLRHELIKLHEADRRPLLYVTHDHEDALALGGRVAVLNNGRIEQIGTPREIYERPATRFVASFIGKPSMNFYEVRKSGYPGAVCGVRPEHWEVCNKDEALFCAPIEDVQYGGFYSDILARFNNAEMIVRYFGVCTLKVGDTVCVKARPENMHCFDQVGNRIAP
jgi:ABC-type sugar transport system ATPase subunit